MKYVLSIYNDECDWDSVSDEDRDAITQAYGVLTQEMQEEGVLVAGEALYPTQTATTVRVRDGEKDVTDGPFAETKEQLGGFYLLDVKNLDEAIEWASKIPGALRGSIEIRPVMVFAEAGNVVEEATA